MQKDKNIEQLRKEFIFIKVLSWILLSLIAIVVSFIIIKDSHAATAQTPAQLNSAAQATSNPYGSSGNLNGLMSYGQKNITTSCEQSPNFINTSYTVGSSGDISAEIQMNTDNGSGYNYTYNIPAIISGVCSNGFISCPAGQWYGGGVTCNNYSIQYSPSSGFSLQSLGSNIMGVPASTTVNIALNGTQTSTVTNPNATAGGLANCFCLNDSCEQGGTPISEIRINQILTDLGGQAVSAVTSGSPDTVGASTINTATSPYSIIYSGGNSSSCNGNSNYTTTNNLEGLYSQGGNALNNEVSSSQVATANTNTESALGLTSTPDEQLVNIQNNTFPGGSGSGTCQIENLVSFSNTMSYSNISYSSSQVSNPSGGYAAGGATTQSGNSSCTSSANTIEVQANNPQSTCSAGCIGGITESGLEFIGNGVCSGTISVDSKTGIISGGQITCNLGAGSCSNGGTITFTGGGNTLSVSGSVSGSLTLHPQNKYTAVLTRPVDSCPASWTGCTITQKTVCDQNDANCNQIVPSSETTAPDYTWIHSETDANYGSPDYPGLTSPTLGWTVDMKGTSINVTPSETIDTSGGGTLATSSAPYFGDDYPNVSIVYSCKGNSSLYNFDTLNKQATAVTGSASMNSSNTAFSYTGVNGNQHNNIAINNPTNYSSQQYECVVEQTAAATSISSSLTAQTANQVTPLMGSSTNTKTLNCTNSGTVDAPVWNCPVPSGYTIQTNCTQAANINNSNFAPAAVDLQVLDKAGASLICSAN